ncbi:dGTP triphosphohydrolase [Silvibacterium dinghuense]|uniref:Deoxyguanosinetriphosphate triphosphohydrolase-like protein n=1 Tax=Silvibacterium dinghuense TaxID=1560006 RepID=A0A4Q1SHA2_9BACT|nr:dNTP triphosphohydrolase [Silvibacterium dinghuense]RXS96951.1 dNTP triphosphohydrolase [Silvibacterium dinghuense]
MTDDIHRLPAACAVSNEGPLSERQHLEPPHSYRPAFDRDRARIIHARAFRRLAGKTQVFTHRSSDHFRSRLTHTMEVAQIARTVAATLGLNEPLAESLALVHDIGHPPFGHTGEHALDKALRPYGLRFDHNLHALRIVEYFETSYAGFRGLNLTLGVREGIIKHSRDYSAVEHPELAEYFLDLRPPLEAQLIDVVDEIAYLTADLDDGIEAGILSLEEAASRVTLFRQFWEPMLAKYPDARDKLVFNEALKRMLNALVGDLIAETARRVESAGALSLDAIRHHPERLAALSPEMEALRVEAKAFLSERLYRSPELAEGRSEAEKVVATLFQAWVEEPSRMPAGQLPDVETEGAPRAVADYIAGMTDLYILGRYEEFLDSER